MNPRLHPLLLALALTGPIQIPSICHAGVWFSGVDPVVLHDRDKQAPGNDFMDMFKAGAPWDQAERHIQVFKVSTQFLHRSSDEQLSAVVSYLKSRHITLAMEAEIMATSVHCGNGRPGFTTPAVIRKAVERVKAAAGRIDYVAFDEPIAFGESTRGKGACGFSVGDLARNIAPNIETIRSAFPDVRFGDIEPVTDATLADHYFDNRILPFIKAFQDAGSRLKFIQADLIWQNQWRPQLVEWKSRLRAAGIRYGVVIDGDPADRNDGEWETKALQRYHLMATDPQVSPDDFIFQSWQTHPLRFLPDRKAGTLTNVVVRALQ